MEELIKSLKKAAEELELITELTLKYNDLKVVGDKLIQKSIEDGILAKLNTANLYQLNQMKKYNYFRYYGKELTDKLIDIAIIKVTRKQKLDKLNNL